MLWDAELLSQQLIVGMDLPANQVIFDYKLSTQYSGASCAKWHEAAGTTAFPSMHWTSATASAGASPNRIMATCDLDQAYRV